LRIVHGMLHLMVCNKAAILIEDKESRRCSARVDSANVGRHSIMWERREDNVRTNEIKCGSLNTIQIVILFINPLGGEVLFSLLIVHAQPALWILERR
jgi:hypothetical protein